MLNTYFSCRLCKKLSIFDKNMLLTHIISWTPLVGGTNVKSLFGSFKEYMIVKFNQMA